MCIYIQLLSTSSYIHIIQRLYEYMQNATKLYTLSYIYICIALARRVDMVMVCGGNVCNVYIV